MFDRVFDFSNLGPVCGVEVALDRYKAAQRLERAEQRRQHDLPSMISKLTEAMHATETA